MHFLNQIHMIYIYLSRKIHPLKFLALYRELIPIRSMAIQVYFGISVYQLIVLPKVIISFSLFLQPLYTQGLLKSSIHLKLYPTMSTIFKEVDPTTQSPTHT